MKEKDFKEKKCFVYPTIVDDVFWKKISSSNQSDIKKYFYLNVLSSNLFNNKILLPVKSILNNPFFFDFFKNNVSKHSDQFKRIISLLFLNKDDTTIKTVCEELCERLKKDKNSMNIKTIKKLNHFADLLEECKLDKVYRNKIEFHKKYLADLIFWIEMINTTGLKIGNGFEFPKMSLSVYLHLLKNEQQKEMTETEYFGAKRAEQLAFNSVPHLMNEIKKIVNPLWIYDSSELFQHETIVPEEYNPFWTLLEKGINKKNQIKIISFPVRFYFEYDSFSVKDIADLSNDLSFIKFRELIKDFNESDIGDQVNYHEQLLDIFQNINSTLHDYSKQSTKLQKKAILSELYQILEKKMDMQKKEKNIVKISLEKIHDLIGYMSITTVRGAVRFGIKGVVDPNKFLEDLSKSLGFYDEKMEVLNLDKIVPFEKPMLDLQTGQVEIAINASQYEI